MVHLAFLLLWLACWVYEKRAMSRRVMYLAGRLLGMLDDAKEGKFTWLRFEGETVAVVAPFDKNKPNTWLNFAQMEAGLADPTLP